MVRAACTGTGRRLRRLSRRAGGASSGGPKITRVVSGRGNGEPPKHQAQPAGTWVQRSLGWEATRTRLGVGVSWISSGCEASLRTSGSDERVASAAARGRNAARIRSLRDGVASWARIAPARMRRQASRWSVRRNGSAMTRAPSSDRAAAGGAGDLADQDAPGERRARVELGEPPDGVRVVGGGETELVGVSGEHEHSP